MNEPTKSRILRDIADAISTFADDKATAVHRETLVEAVNTLVAHDAWTPRERQLIGNFHFCRYSSLPEGDDEPALQASVEWYSSLLPDHADLIPDQIRQAIVTDVDTDAHVDQLIAFANETTGSQFAAAAGTICGLLADRFEEEHHREDILLAIHFGTAAYLVPDLPVQTRSPIASNLGVAHLDLAESSNSETHLDRAVELFAEAARLEPSADHFGNLATALLTRFELRGRNGDLASALHWSHKAIAAPFPAQAQWLSLRGMVLRAEYEHRPDAGPDLLRDAEDCGRRALSATAPDSDGYARRAANLATTLITMFESGDRSVSLVEAEMLARASCGVAGAGYATRLATLSSILRIVGSLRGDVDLLEEAFLTSLRAVAQLPADHSDRPDLLAEAANTAMTWFDWSGDRQVIDHAVTSGRLASDALRGTSRRRAGSADANLAMHLLTRAELSTTDDDLRDAVACAERAVFELPEDATVLSDAALVFRIHAETVADSDRASMAVEYAERALARAEASGLDPGQFLANLAQCLFVDGQPGPARRMAERALHAVDTSSSTYSAVAAILARIVDGTKPPGDSDALWRSVTDSVATPLPLRAQAWTLRASSAARQQDWETATAHYEAAIADMAQLASDRIDPRSRLDRLLDHTDTPSDAAAAALQLDDSARALTLLEHGRSLVLGTGIDSRGDTVRLSASHPDHARRLAALALARRTL